MLSPCRSTARRVSNAVASCSYTSTRLAATATERHQSSHLSKEKERRRNGYGDFVKRLSAHREHVGEDGKRANWKDRKGGNTPISLTVKGLRPYEVASRVNILIEENKLDHAITMVENLPLDTVNVAVWNTLITAAIKAARYKLAFELYYDMKRRHVQPNTRTFTTLFVGLSRIEDWTPYSNILQRVFTTYDQLLVHFEKLKAKNPESKDITPWPINGFLTLLGKAHRHSKMWDVFFNMEGRLAPDEYTYTVLLRALQSRTSLDQEPVQSDLEAEEAKSMDLLDKERWEDQYGTDLVPEEKWGFNPVDAKQATKIQESVHYKNAADARILWDSIIKANKSDPDGVPLSSFLISPTLHLLSRGRPADHTLAFDIIAQYVRVKIPGTSNAVNQSPNAIDLNPNVLFAILDVCIRSARSELAIQYFQTIAEDPTTKKMIDSGHMVYIMRAFAMRRVPKGQVHDGREAISALQWMLNELKSRELSQGAGRLAPSTPHFIYALTAAWRGADMSSALTAFELMTGIERKEFMVPVLQGAAVRWPQRLKYSGCYWNVTCMALLVKTAEATQKRDNMRIAMRILNAADPMKCFMSRFGDEIKEETLAAQNELARRMIRVLDALLEGTTEAEANVWRRMKVMVEMELKKLNTTVVRNFEDKSREEELRKAGMVKDADVQLLVTLKGRKSAWASNL